MLKVLLATILLFLFVGCGSVDENRHTVDEKSEIAIQEKLESSEMKDEVIAVDKVRLNSVQEELQSSESKSSDATSSPMTEGLEYNTDEGGFE